MMDAPPAPQRRRVNWSTLLPDVLTVITRSLSIEDCLAVRGVCSPWRDAAKKLPCRVFDHLPIRLMVRRSARDERRAVFGFFTIGGQRLLDVEVSDAALGRFRCCGHRDGWLALVSDEGDDMLFLNPVTDDRVRLPTCCKVSSDRSPGPKLGSPLLVDVKKVVMSASPSAKGCIVAAVGRCSRVALCRPDDGGKWITLDAGRGGTIEDVMFTREGKLFVLATDGSLRICDLRSYPRAAAVSVVQPGVHLAVHNYSVLRRCLVELSGEVMVVSRDYAEYRHGAAAFRVFKLLPGPSATWTPVTDLGYRSLLVSSCSCESITVAAGSKDTCLRKNSIYFTRKVNNYFPMHVGDVGVFSLDSMTTTMSICISGEYLQDHDAVWVRPSL